MLFAYKILIVLKIFCKNIVNIKVKLMNITPKKLNK